VKTGLQAQRPRSFVAQNHIKEKKRISFVYILVCSGKTCPHYIYRRVHSLLDDYQDNKKPNKTVEGLNDITCT
jgi:hypothetical protein